jgi:hypothetical protein
VDYIDRVDSFSSVFFSESFWIDAGSGSLRLMPGRNWGYAVSERATAQIAFNAVSVSWIADVPEGASLKVEIRVQDERGESSEWFAVAASDMDVAFPQKGLSYQYRLTLNGNAEGESPEVRSLVFFYNRIDPAMFQETPASSYRAAVPKPAVVSRSAWGARAPKGSYTPHSPSRITIHHTWRPTAQDYRGASSVRAIQNYHMDNNGWMDIGYHFLIGTYPSSGETSIFQGRPENVVGAHTGGQNTNNVGVNVIGDYTTETLHGNSYARLIDLLAWICSRYGIDPGRIYGHKDFNSTACPGENVYRRMDRIRQDVRDRIQAARASGN